MSSLEPTSAQVLNNVEMGDPVSEKRVLAFGNSTVDILVGNAKSEDAEVKVIPIVLTSHVDDYPDGGLAAWSVVVGVGPSINSVFRNLLIKSTNVGYVRYLCNVGRIPQVCVE
jgi:hypothetical protein